MAPRKQAVDLDEVIGRVRHNVDREHAMSNGQLSLSHYLRQCNEDASGINVELVIGKVEQMEALIADLLKPRDYGSAF